MNFVSFLGFYKAGHRERLIETESERKREREREKRQREK